MSWLGRRRANPWHGDVIPEHDAESPRAILQATGRYGVSAPPSTMSRSACTCLRSHYVICVTGWMCSFMLYVFTHTPCAHGVTCSKLLWLIDASINVSCIVIGILVIAQGCFLLSPKDIIENLQYSYREGWAGPLMSPAKTSCPLQMLLSSMTVSNYLVMFGLLICFNHLICIWKSFPPMWFW